jgi:hypothetical protein
MKLSPSQAQGKQGSPMDADKPEKPAMETLIKNWKNMKSLRRLVCGSTCK